MNQRRWALLIVIAAGMGACRTGRDYTSADEPRFAGAPAISRVGGRAVTDTLRIVSFNIEFSLRVDSAIALIQSEPALRDADVVALQEMDEEGTRRVAEALGMWYVYYPAIRHKRTKRNFGNAVLSRWPIVEDAKITLPHASRYAKTHRIATAATIDYGDTTRVRIYSTHLGTLADIGGCAREDQLRAILKDGERYPIAIVAGDMNSGDIGRMATRAGYMWPTEKGPSTTMMFRWDHVFLKGLTVAKDGSGTIRDQRGTSDHRPIWVVAAIQRD